MRHIELAVRCSWLHRCSSSSPDRRLVGAVEATDFPGGRVDVFVHGEAGEIRAVRRHLLGDRGLDREHMSISPYWRRRYTDEGWRAAKSDWLAEVEQDV